MAARIERAECQTVLAFAAQMQARGADVMIHEIGGTSAVFGGSGQPFNKLAGLGFAEPIDEDAMARVERDYDARGAELRVELSTLADPSAGLLLTRRGYELAGYENVLGLRLDGDLHFAAGADAGGDVIVSRAGADETGIWIDTVTDGFFHPDVFDGPPPTESFGRETILDVMAVSRAVPGLALYLARRGGAIAGGGSVRIADRLAQLSGASTLPAHRRRGVQSTLLRARLLDAAHQGCDLAIVTTEPASKSQENVQRAGFALLYSRAVLIRRANAAPDQFPNSQI
jgi:GNAT superfamily N-acetyltransferase